MKTPTLVLFLLTAALLLGPCDLMAQESAGSAPGREAPDLTQPSIQLGAPFADNAVFQQGIPVPVWGVAKPGVKLKVTFDKQTKTAVADAHGKWRITLDPMPADKLASVHDAPVGRRLTVMADDSGVMLVNTVTNILIGEVWLCSGQSNMAGRMGNGKTPIADANFPALRQMVAPETGPWLVCTPENAPGFKRVCFYFARRLQSDILVPIGIINAAVGGSNIESWLNQPPSARGAHYDRFIDPLAGFGLRGVVWYQGESNEKDGRKYLPKLRSLILGWREAWQQPDSPLTDGPRADFSVYFVQLPNIGKVVAGNPAGGDGRAEIRNAQLEALALPHTGMSVAIDIGAEKEHPPNKLDTGVRLARLALHHDYGKKDLVPCGPLYKGFKIEGGAIRIRFDCAQNGLMLASKDGYEPPVPTPNAKMPWLSIQAKDGTWHWADGKIDGPDLIVSCPDVKEPIAVRYAYTQNPAGCYLYNTDGLPASPFTTCGF